MNNSQLNTSGPVAIDTRAPIPVARMMDPGTAFLACEGFAFRFRFRVPGYMSEASVNRRGLTKTTVACMSRGLELIYPKAQDGPKALQNMAFGPRNLKL